MIRSRHRIDYIIVLFFLVPSISCVSRTRTTPSRKPRPIIPEYLFEEAIRQRHQARYIATLRTEEAYARCYHKHRNASPPTRYCHIHKRLTSRRIFKNDPRYRVDTMTCPASKHSLSPKAVVFDEKMLPNIIQNPSSWDGVLVRIPSFMKFEDGVVSMGRRGFFAFERKFRNTQTKTQIFATLSHNGFTTHFFLRDNLKRDTSAKSKHLACKTTSKPTQGWYPTEILGRLYVEKQFFTVSKKKKDRKLEVHLFLSLL